MSFKYKLLGNVEFGNEIDSILSAKGISNTSEFLNPTDKHLESPYLFDNIENARDTLIKHINSKSKMLIIVDSDVDGYTSASLIYQYLKKISPELQIDYMLHAGKQHGLKDLIDDIYGTDYKLIIVPDAGSNDVAECSELYIDNKEIIILDHHIVTPLTQGLPLKHNDGWYALENPAIIVNNQVSDRITDKAMTGVGVVYKFCKVLDDYYNVNYADDYIDLVAIGMIADRCDMTNLQSRYLINKGLNKIQNKTNGNKFISTLVEAQGYVLNYRVTINGVGFYITPLMNSLIRLGSLKEKKIMFEALCNSNKKLTRKIRGKGEVELSIQEYALKSCESTIRKQRRYTNESVEKLSEDINKHKLNNYPILICNAGEDIDKNFTGLIANKLTSVYQRPCLLMRRDENYCSGSGRGYYKSNIVDFNKWCQDTGLFKFVQGHDNAFGCAISFNNTYKLFDIVSNMPNMDKPTYHVYGVYDDKTLNSEIIKRVARYDWVWGSNIDEPLFYIENITINKYNINLLGKKQNRLEFIYHDINFIMFSKGGSLLKLYNDIFNTGDFVKFKIVGRFTTNNKKAQVIIEDLMFEKSEVKSGFGLSITHHLESKDS